MAAHHKEEQDIPKKCNVVHDLKRKNAKIVEKFKFWTDRSIVIDRINRTFYQIIGTFLIHFYISRFIAVQSFKLFSLIAMTGINNNVQLQQNAITKSR